MIKTTVNNEEKEIEQIRLPDGRYVDYVDVKVGDNYQRVFTSTRTIKKNTDTNNSYKSLDNEDSTLKNYRIYGQTSRNLFDFDEWSKNINANSDNSLTKDIDGITITANSNDAFTVPYAYAHEGVYKIYVKPNTNYLLSWVSNNNLYGRVYVFKNGGVDKSHAINVNNAEKKYLLFDTDTNTEFVALRFGVSNAGDSITYSKIMLNEGSTPLPYEPYGESVGDLVTSGEHAGEYKVPVTVEGKNLAKNNYAKSSTLFTVEEVNNFIHVSGTNNSGSTKAYVISKENMFPAGSYDIVNNSDTTIGYDYKDNNDALVYGTVSANSIKTFNFPAVVTRYLNIYKSVPNGESIDNYFQVMIVKHGDDTDTYEPYHAPVTTPIYLPEQIRKVGDEAEYIDYGEQKQHRVRKNLLLNTAASQSINGLTFMVNTDKSITVNGTATEITKLFLGGIRLIKNVPYKISGCPSGGSNNTYRLDPRYTTSGGVLIPFIDTGNGSVYTSENDIALSIYVYVRSGYTCDNLTFYPMIRKADIEDDTYEPYIENTDLDVTLPALPTLTGTNVLSVGTEVRPSVMEVKGHIKNY